MRLWVKGSSNWLCAWMAFVLKVIGSHEVVCVRRCKLSYEMRREVCGVPLMCYSSVEMLDAGLLLF